MENSTSMQSKKIIVFDISSEYGHFRKFNTTTSPLTYSIPSRPAIIGMIGAISGIEREIGAGKFHELVVPVAEVFSKENADVAIQILNPIKKANIAFNLLDTEKTAASFFNIKQRTQIEFELLKNPSFRIFVSIKDENLFEQLVSKLQENKTHFTPYMGLSQFTATTNLVTVEVGNSIISQDYIDIQTAVNISNTERKFDFKHTSEFKYNSDTMPIEMTKDRVVVEYSEVIIETNGQGISVKTTKAYSVGAYGNIIFL